MQRSPSAERFALQPGERLLGRAEVVADTPALAGTPAMVWVTDRRVALCRAPGRLLALVTVAVGALAVGVGVAASGPDDGALRGLLIALFVLVVVGRSLLRFRRVLAVARGGEVVDVAQDMGQVGILLRDGSTWRLRPARHLLVMAGPTAQRRFAGAVQGLLRLVGRTALVPVWRTARP